MTENRSKYKQVKERGKAWKIKAEKLSEELDTVYKLNKSLEETNSQLRDHINSLPDDEEIDRLQEKYKTQKKVISHLKEENKKLEQKLTLKEVKIQQLEEYRKDLKEQYNELKSDFKEYQRWTRNKE